MDAIKHNIVASVRITYVDPQTNKTEARETDSFALAIPDAQDEGYFTYMNRVDDLQITGAIASLIEGGMDIMSPEGKVILENTLRYYANEMHEGQQHVKELN